MPQVEVGIELTSKSLDVEQRLLQQDELWLHFHVELARRLKQRYQEMAEGNFLERFFENRFAYLPYDVFELRDLGFFRNPSGLDMQPRDLAVVLVEEREQVAREIVLIVARQAADDRAIDCDVAWILRVGSIDEDVSRVHVG